MGLIHAAQESSGVSTLKAKVAGSFPEETCGSGYHHERFWL